MDDQKKKKIVTGVVIAALAAAFVISAVVWIVPRAPSGAPAGGQAGTGGGGNAPAPKGITEVSFPQSSYDIALARASVWRSDAKPVRVMLTNAADSSWTYLFVSSTAKGKGFQVSVRGQDVIIAAEVPFLGAGAPLPANLISPDQAIATARMAPGYGNEAVISVELVYIAAGRQWYWGVKMPRGTASIKATP